MQKGRIVNVCEQAVEMWKARKERIFFFDGEVGEGRF